MVLEKALWHAPVRDNMLSWTNPTKIGEDYYFNFKNQSNLNLAPLNAAQYTVEYIAKNYPAPYTLYLSGGVDSQAMLYAWHRSGVPYQTFSAVYNNALNEHDLVYLRTFAAQHNIPVTYHDFDLLAFLANEHDAYANRYRCGSPQITTFMKLADLTEQGTVCMSGNFILKPKMVGIPDRNNFSLYYYGLLSGKSIVPFFFLETCELAYAFETQIPEIMIHHEPGSYPDKVLGYQHYGFPVIKQKSKLNGFERVKDFYDANPPRQPTLEEKFARLSGQTSNRIFDLLHRNKYEAKFQKYKYVVRC